MEGFIIKASRANNKFDSKQKFNKKVKSRKPKAAYKRPSTRKQAISY